MHIRIGTMFHGIDCGNTLIYLDSTEADPGWPNLILFIESTLQLIDLNFGISVISQK